MRRPPLRLLLPCLALLAGSARAAQEPEAAAAAKPKKVLSVDDYGRWSRVDSVRLSDDGLWLSHARRPAEGEGRLVIRELSGERSYEFERGTQPEFSDDSRWATVVVTPPEKAKNGQRGLRLLRLEDGEIVEFENAGSASFSPASTHVAIRKGGGKDLLVRELTSGRTRNLGNVGSYAFAEERPLLAWTVDAADDHGNGVCLLELGTDRLRVIDSSREDYTMRWCEDGRTLAWLAGTTPKGHERRANRLGLLRDVAAAGERRHDYAPDADEDFPEGMVLSHQRGPSISEDGSMVFLGLQTQREEFDAGDDEQPEVDVWHWKDAPVQSIQARRAGRERNRTELAVLHLDGSRLLRLADDRLRRVDVVGDGRWAVGSDATPYEHEVSWGGSRADWYRIDLHTGARTPITDALGRPMGTSPDGRWFLFLKGERVWVENLDTGALRDLSSAAPVDFVNRDDDHPYELPAYGVSGWTRCGSVVLRHEHDLWAVPLDGSEARCLTQGAGDAERIRYRIIDLDPEEDWLDLEQPLLLSAFGTWSKKSGFATLEPGAAPRSLVMEDCRFGRPTKAAEADTVVLSRESFVDFPDLYCTDLRFQDLRRVSEANPQQAEYHWGRRRLIEYENSRGRRLQATVTLPANYQEGQRYPTLVYFYERMSDRHHSYSMPRYDDRPQMSTYASDGYLVLMPDVVYEPGRPGSSAVDCVGAATRRAIELGLADPEHIALQGHSWGGYQSSFILTQTDLFCCVVTGAPVTNLISFYGELYKSSGSIQQGIVEVGQVRMGTTPWDNMELYQSQSPWHQVRKITTPFVILHGTDDGAVDWHQGLEYYAAARRNGKEVVLLSYPGEGHHLDRRPNQIDFQVRMKQFFDHYCKGAPAPSWWTKGVPYLDRDRSPPRPRPDDTDAPKEERKPDDDEDFGGDR